MINYLCISYYEKDTSNWTFSDWHQPSGQPNDCILPETCVFIGPNGKVIEKASDHQLSQDRLRF